MSQAKAIIVIGGSAAGPKAAARARRMDEYAEITIIQKDPDLSMASCGYPYYVGGFFDDRNMLLTTPAGVVRDPKFYINAKGIVAKTETEAIEINRKNKAVRCKNLKTGDIDEIPYDKLIIATGATPKLPSVPGIGLAGITTLQSMKDADYLRRIRDEREIKKAVVIGGGLIGIETSEALELAGMEITIIELLPQLLTFLDWEMAKLVENHVKSKNANVITENGLAAFLGEDGKLTAVKLQNGIELPCELAVVAIGLILILSLPVNRVSPSEKQGVFLLTSSKTSDKDIYAVGDCIELPNFDYRKEGACALWGSCQSPGTRGWRECKALGNSATFPGTIQTGICKVSGEAPLGQPTFQKKRQSDWATLI